MYIILYIRQKVTYAEDHGISDDTGIPVFMPVGSQWAANG